MQKRLMAINDLSCYGRCAMTVTLPVLSAAGIECSVIPTAVLSTHLAYPNPPKLDMTDMIGKITKHLKGLDIKFDAIASGYLETSEQAEYIGDFFRSFKTADNFIMVDPTMADNGKMYKNPNYNDEFIDKTRSLFKMADIVIPNITEAAFICGLPFKEPPYAKESGEIYIESLIKSIRSLGPKKIIITGVSFDENNIGSAVFDSDNNRIKYTFAKKYNGRYIGTGDLFASVVLAALLNGFDVYKAAETATEHVSYCIEKSNEENTKDSMAINFEQCMGKLIEGLGI